MIRIRTVVVLSTGGTIASRLRDGAFVSADDAGEMATQIAAMGFYGLHRTLDVRWQDVSNVNSFRLSVEDMLELSRRIRSALEDRTVAGVVVTHGTDTMEESAYLADLLHDDPRPVVFTGAQRAVDLPGFDGVRNLADALLLASHPDARSFGALIAFEGEVFPAAGTIKRRTLSLAAFGSEDVGSVGWIRGGVVRLHARPRRFPAFPFGDIGPNARVDIVPYYPGADIAALRAVVAAGARGVVLEGTGVGNANGQFCAEVEALTRAGVIVALSTRVPFGPVATLYGAGGGRDLVRAGAIPVGVLRSPQARILLMVLLWLGFGRDELIDEFRKRTGEVPTATDQGTSSWRKSEQ